MLGLGQVRRSCIMRLAVEKLPSDAALDAGDGVNTIAYLVKVWELRKSVRAFCS